MNQEWLNYIHNKARSRVSVACDEYHVHSADCLNGPEDAVAICKLAEMLREQHAAVERFVKEFSRA